MAVIFYNGFFACNAPVNDPSKNDSIKQAQQNAKEKKISLPFNCATDADVPLGYLDTSWIYKNPGLGFEFRFPKGWNATDDLRNAGPTFVSVGGNYYDFRESYLKPRSSNLQVMQNESWGNPRFLFGFTHINQPSYSDTATINYDDSVYVSANLFFADYFDERSLYKEVSSQLIQQWKQQKIVELLELNEHTMPLIKIEKIGSADFYTQVIKIPVEQGKILYTATTLKKKGCLFFMFVYRWYTEKEHAALLEGMQGLTL